MSTIDGELYSADIVIVGAGMVGALTACLLTEHDKDINIALVDRQPASTQLDTSSFDPRVVALSEHSIAMLENVQVWSKIQKKRACPYKKMRVWDAEGTGHIHFDCGDLALDQLGYIVEHKVIMSALNSRLKQNKNIQQFRECSIHNVQRARQTVQLHLIQKKEKNKTEKKWTIESPLLIAADGGNSKIRQLDHFPMREWDYNQTAIITTLQCENSHEDTAWQRFSENGPLAYLPLTRHDEKNRVSIVWSLDSDLAEEKMALTAPRFCDEVGAAMEYALGKIHACDKRYSIPLYQKMALRYFHDGIALVGDAAHSIHPLAGQGVNLGFADAEVLVTELIRARARHVPLHDSSILRRYEMQRQAQNIASMLAMASFKRIFGSKNIVLRYLRNTGLTTANDMNFIRTWFTKIASGELELGKN